MNLVVTLHLVVTLEKMEQGSASGGFLGGGSTPPPNRPAVFVHPNIYPKDKYFYEDSSIHYLRSKISEYVQ